VHRRNIAATGLIPLPLLECQFTPVYLGFQGRPREADMRAIYTVLLVAMAGAILFTGSYGVAQSLGDVAREQRQKAKDAKAAPKVLTN